MTHRAAITCLNRLVAVNLVLLMGLALLIGTGAHAHELRPAIFTATIDETGSVELRGQLNLEAWLAGIGSEHDDTAQSDKAKIYDRLRASPAADVRAQSRLSDNLLASGVLLETDQGRVVLDLGNISVPETGDVSLARTSILTFKGRLPAAAASVSWQASEQFGDTVIRLQRKGAKAPFYSALVSAGTASAEVPLAGVAAQSIFASLVQYTVIGFEHIIPKGLDHILFVVGLFLLSPYLRPLLWQVSGFTLAHSVTLALSIYGLVQIPASIVEPLIALSIAFIAVENLFTSKLQRWRPAAVFGFGLLHGLGFAGVLSEIGLPQNQFVISLIGFNVGVERGQLAVLAGCFLGFGLWLRRHSWYRKAVSMPASAAVAIIAMVWFVERIA